MDMVDFQEIRKVRFNWQKKKKQKGLDARWIDE